VVVARYGYTAEGRRVLRALGPGASPTTRYLYAGSRVLEERDAANTVLRQFVDGRAPGEHIQLLDHSTVAPPLAVPLFYHSNSQGSVGALTDSAGTPLEHYEYSWLGRPRILADLATSLPQSLFANPYLFQGQRYDAETETGSELNGLYWHGERYYSPQTGEYITNDAAGNWNGGQGNGYGAFGGDGWNMHPSGGPSLEEVLGPLTQPEVYGPSYEEFLRRRFAPLGLDDMHQFDGIAVDFDGSLVSEPISETVDKSTRLGPLLGPGSVGPQELQLGPCRGPYDPTGDAIRLRPHNPNHSQPRGTQCPFCHPPAKDLYDNGGYPAGFGKGIALWLAGQFVLGGHGREKAKNAPARAGDWIIWLPQPNSLSDSNACGEFDEVRRFYWEPFFIHPKFRLDQDAELSGRRRLRGRLFRLDPDDVPLDPDEDDEFDFGAGETVI
jgi:RHS repeat-associated protein